MRDEKNRLHYVRVANAETMVALEQGSIVRVSGADPQQIGTDARIAEVARQNHGVYSVPARSRQPAELRLTEGCRRLPAPP